MTAREVLLSPYLWHKAGSEHHKAFLALKRTTDTKEQCRIYYEVMCPLLDQTWKYIGPAYLMIVAYLAVIAMMLATAWAALTWIRS